MENIEFYFNKYQSDKFVNGYSGVYNELFEPRRNDPIKLLEIGIGTLNSTESNMQFWKVNHETYLPGASLKAFRDYFPKGIIHGIDIQSDCMIMEHRIYTYLVDSTQLHRVDYYLQNLTFDFIIDDGNHNIVPQLMTFENFFPRLNDGGVYILEDLAFPDALRSYFSQKTYKYEFRNGLIVIKK